MGDWGHCVAVSAGPDLGLWPDVCQREHGGHGLPVHHLQLPAGNVHLHLSLCAAEEGTDSFSRCALGLHIHFMLHRTCQKIISSVPCIKCPEIVTFGFGLIVGLYVLVRLLLFHTGA